jgi:hypothetical protein
LRVNPLVCVQGPLSVTFEYKTSTFDNARIPGNQEISLRDNKLAASIQVKS